MAGAKAAIACPAGGHGTWLRAGDGGTERGRGDAWKVLLGMCRPCATCLTAVLSEGGIRGVDGEEEGC